ncbi:MAG TPA: SDR family oxidoreductase [Thermoanaerobaculia bacterium]|nr:SDR family oxidoreductase [Thermoanaerobaculia bacterium]
MTTLTTEDPGGPDTTKESSFLERLRAALDLLEAIDDDRGLLAHADPEERQRLLDLTRRVSDPDHRARRRLVKANSRHRKAARVDGDEKVRAETGIRRLRRKVEFSSPNIYPPEGFVPHDGEEPPRQTTDSQHCYVCKQHYVTVHHFYDQLCPACAELNFAKRSELADLSGRVALLTGGRVKIGYQAGLKLLRSGARLIVTTRFPRDSAVRYAREPDFEQWGDRLEIFGLDLRHTPSVEAFCRELLSSHGRLDFIINNACQTVRRPPAFYQHMMAGEAAALSTMTESQRRLVGSYEGLRSYHLLAEGGAPDAAASGDQRRPDFIGLTHAAQLSQVPLLPEHEGRDHDLFPEGRLDQDLQQVDLRARNSWRLLMAEVSSVELLEVQLVNAIAPFILNARLKPLMLRTADRDKHIVNVSAVEGQFYRNQKTTRHPHTNMAKAALNMMTRTAAADYYGDGIHMNSVDTGWVTDEDPSALAARKTAQHRFHPPLDIIDGAARIVDPIVSGVNTGVHVWGQFLKDYKPADW